jgi:hypothetical protein
MSYSAVDLFTLDSSPAQNPIGGVVVRVYSQDGKHIYTQGTSDDVTGHVGFLLPDSMTYELRFYKQQVQFKNPQLIAVVPEPGANVFVANGQVFTPPAATDARLCRASGFFRDPTGASASGVEIDIITKFDPILLEGAAVVTERVHATTDENGYVELDLIRFGQYDVTVSGFEDTTRTISVPDAPSVNLPDLLFPVVASVRFAEPGPYTVAVADGHGGNDLLLTPMLLTTDGRVLDGTGTGDVQWSSSDPLVLAVFPSGTKVTVRGLSPGTAQILVNRLDSTIIRIPNTPIAGQPVPVTVT